MRCNATGYTAHRHLGCRVSAPREVGVHEAATCPSLLTEARTKSFLRYVVRDQSGFHPSSQLIHRELGVQVDHERAFFSLSLPSGRMGEKRAAGEFSPWPRQWPLSPAIRTSSSITTYYLEWMVLPGPVHGFAQLHDGDLHDVLHALVSSRSLSTTPARGVNWARPSNASGRT
jgi:hypothetical protein